MPSCGHRGGPREPVPPFLLRSISGTPIPRIHRGNAGCRKQKIAVGTGQKAVFVVVPETPEAKIAGEGSDIGRAGFLEGAAEELFRPVEFHRAWGGVNEVKAGQPSQEMLVAAKVRDVVEEAPVGGIAIYKGGFQLSGRTVGFRRKEHWEPVHETSLGCGIRGDPLVDPAWNERFRHGEIAEVGDFLGFGFEKFQARMGQNEVQNQQPGLDQFTRKAAAIAQVVAVESAVDSA